MDASMEDLNQFPALSSLRPQRKFLGVQVPAMDENFHGWAGSTTRDALIALEVLGEQKTENGDYVFVFYEDNVVRRAPARRFVSKHRAVWDYYLDRKFKGTLLPFDYSGGPPYVHPDSRMRNQVVVTTPPSVEPSDDDGESVRAYRDEDEESSSQESSEENSDGYEEDESETGVRRSTRIRKPVKIPSPKKRSTAMNTRSTRSQQVPTTSASEMEDDEPPSGSDSDIVILDRPPHGGIRSNPRRKVPAKQLAAPAAPPKPRVPRVPRPINLAYGDIYSVDHIETKDPFQAHRPTCGTCAQSPAHVLVNAWRKKAKVSLDSFAKMGGWIQCMRCTEAVHWKCLSLADQAEILRAAQLREKPIEGPDAEPSEAPKRKMIESHETTNWLCSNCTRGGVCIGCHHALDSKSPPAANGVVNGADPENAPLTELLFRCAACRRASHYAHLKSPYLEEDPEDELLIDDIASHYQNRYSWHCDECSSFEPTIDKILAWRPYPASAPILTAEQEEALHFKDHWPREYLVKWIDKSYRRTAWVPHLWLASTNYSRLRNFILNGTKVRLEHLRSISAAEVVTDDAAMDEVSTEELARRRIYEQENGPTLPNRRAEECIPEAWKRIEQILDVMFWVPNKHMDKELAKKNKRRSHVVDSDESAENAETKAYDKSLERLKALRVKSRLTGFQLLPEDAMESLVARKRRNQGVIQDEDVDDVVWCYVKWGELEYAEASWDTPPARGEPGWDDFEAAFSRYVQSQAVFVAKVSDKELDKRDDRDPAKFAQNKMEVKTSFAADPKCQLRPFQVEGVNWLTFQWWRKHPAILADEMGLGKTVQIITFLAKLIEKKIWPHLVVVPNSTILNWMREFQTWAPGIRAVSYYGDAASREIVRNYEIFHSGPTSGQTKLKLHVLVTTYETFLNKSEWAAVFKAPSRWEVLVIDEGQRLKNNNSLLFRQLNQIRVGHRVLMTGTPLNNNLRELFNLMNFVDRENWSNVEDLERQYQQDQLTVALVGELHEKLKQYFLRRTKDILSLPQKHEIIVPVSFTKLQKGLYKSLIEANLSLLDNLLNSNASANGGKPGMKASRTNLRNILMQSRKCVQHPYLIEPTLEPVTESFEEMHRQLIDASGKLKFLKIMLARLKARGKRVLLFSQFVIALDIIEDFVVGEGYKFLRLDGDLKGSLRQKDIDKFNAPDSEYFIYLLSTRAGGVGINLATADTVIIFDPDFNPHQDAQAVSRAHRFGQKKPVIVFRMMAVTGPETKIMSAGKKKLMLDHVIVQNMDEDEAPEDLEGMLLSGAKALFEDNDENDVVYTEAVIDSLITNAEEEASKPKATSDEASGMKFEFAQMWETTNPVEDSDDVNADFWAKMIANAQDEKEKLAAREEEESGRGAKRRAKAMVQTYNFDDSPVKKAKTKNKKSDDDVDFTLDPDPEHLEATGSNTDATSDTDGMIAHVEELRQEISRLVPDPLEAELAKKEAIKQRRREARARRKRELMAASKALPLPHLGPSNGMFSRFPESGDFAPLDVQREAEMQESDCIFCQRRHGPQCPMTQTLDGLRVIRLKMLREETSTADEKREALEGLDEAISKLQAKQAKEALQKKARSGIPTSATPVNSEAPSLSMNAPLLAPKVAQQKSIFPSQVNRPGMVYSANASTSSLTGGHASAPIKKKRPSDGPSSGEPPAKKANHGARPALCPLCALKFHPAVQCPLMNSDLSKMKRRLDQLASNTNPDAQAAIDTLRSQYVRKKKQADKPPAKYIIEISD